MISVDNLSVIFSDRVLFDKVSYVVNDKDRIALTGRNGAGKSTMLKIIAGLQNPTSGRVSIPSGYTIGYLPQTMVLGDDTTVMEEAEKAFSHIHSMEAELEKLNAELCEREDYESEAYQKLLDNINVLNDRLAIIGSQDKIAQTERTLTGLGFQRSDFTRPTSEFSGGWRMRIELAKILLQHPSLLLLDEPTNHLDIESITWLENFIANYSGAVLLVSHDRAFLDAATNRTIEISLGKIYDYKASYTKYVELRKERREQQLRAYQNQQKEIKDTEDFIERFRYKATKSVQVQSRIKALAKIERIEVDEEDTSALRLKFPPAPRSGSYPVIMEGVAKSFGEHKVFENVEMTIERGSKVAFVGKNGEGKSTLVKCIMGELEYDGSLKIGHNVQIGYFAQNQASLLDENLTVFQTIDNVAVGEIRTKIRDILGAFMFGGEASDKKVKVLSGGERSRLAMIKLLLEPVNLLILDEPTNHLDMMSKDVLKQAIKEFDGTAIIVSHDREFLDGLVSMVYEFGGGKVKPHIGGIYDFLRDKNLSNLQELEKKRTTEPQKNNQAKTESKETKPLQPSYTERKQQQKIQRKADKAVAEVERKIADKEAEIKALEEKMASSEITDNAIFTDYANLKKELEALEVEWMYLLN
ncbi:MAG: ABC-F family ATP-binding cassette domain-containing protein [Paludibacteraceae bacterium]|nr:ABC-F family ATP-binding cassette domain-containing protein [Paludibacteraceae bacterium]